MNIFIITTFGSIYDRALPIIEKCGSNIRIIATTKEIYQFFTEYTDYETVMIKTDPNLFSRKTVWKIPYNYIHQFFDYHRIFKHNFNHIFFFGSGYHLTIFHWLHKLKNYNIIHQFPSAPSGTYPSDIDTIFTRFVTACIKIFFGIQVKVIKESGKVAFELHDSFFPDNSIQVHPYRPYNCGIQELYTEKIVKHFKKHENLLILEDLVELGRTTTEQCMRHTNDLLLALKDNCIIKPHPRLKHLYGRAPKREQIPPYIPAEFLMSDQWKRVIGVESQSLIPFSKKTKTISLLKLYQYKDEEVKEGLIKWLTEQSKGAILFPESLEELETML